MRPLPPLRWLAWLVAIAALSGCSTYRDDLARSQRAFEENQHERTLAILRVLEPDLSHLDGTEQAHYAYLRGMTDFRIGYKSDARHWFAVAKAMDEKTPGVIPSDWRTRLDQSLAELDAQVWTAGMESLAVAPAEDAKHRRAGKHPAKKTEPAPPAAEDEEEEEAPKASPKKKPKPASDDDEE